jgi:hypothetical protein
MIKTKNTKQKATVHDVEIAALKLEVLTQTEIAKNNKDAYDEIYEKNIGYTVEIGELNQHITKLNAEIKRLLPFEKLHELDKRENTTLRGEIETLKSVLKFESDQYAVLAMNEMNQREVARISGKANNELRNKLDRIPNWIKWFFV